MVHAAAGAPLEGESLLGERVARAVGMEEFDCDIGAAHQIGGAVDDAHPTGAEHIMK